MHEHMHCIRVLGLAVSCLNFLSFDELYCYLKIQVIFKFLRQDRDRVNEGFHKPRGYKDYYTYDIQYG